MTWRLEEGSAAHVGLRRLWWSAIAIAVLAVPAVVPTLRLHLAWETATWAVAVLGLNVAVGFAGQISLGHAAFVGVGAYTCVILSADHGWPLFATVPAAGAVSFVVGFVIGVPALRFRGLYLALLTLAVGTAFGPILGVLIGSALWWGVLSAAVSRVRGRFDARWQRRVNRASALLLGAFALWAWGGLLSG